MNFQQKIIPRILIIDDMFGRVYEGTERNQAREGLCAKYLLQDVTGDQEDKDDGILVKKSLAEAVFCRAQTPLCSLVGDTVENDLKECLRTVESGWKVAPGELPWSLVLLDLCFYTGLVTKESNQRNLGMPSGRPSDDSPDSYFGLTILMAIRERFPELPVIIMSSMPRDEVSRQFSVYGASGFLDRVADESPSLLKEYLWRYGLLPDDTGTIVGHSKLMLLTLRSARRIALSRLNVLICGPRGSGKGMVSKYIHTNSKQPEASYIPINLGGANPNLYESLLFGHVKGAFTGADKDHKGAIEEANKGSLFMDEIAGIPEQVQYGLLHILEDKKVKRLGANKAIDVDVHFISATNEDIESGAIFGQGFRLDLLDRLRSGGTLRLPSLSKRKEDIPLLAKRFVHEAETHFDTAYRREITQEALNKLSQYDWPGNVRELRQCIFEAVAENQDVEHMVPNHIHLLQKASPAKVPRHTRIGRVQPRQSAMALDDVLNLLSVYDFSALDRKDITGRLEKIESACRLFKASYLKTTLEKTRTPIEGKTRITTAIKMATANPNIKTAKAADMVKGILKFLVPLDDAVLKEAYETAVALRSRKPKTTEKSLDK